MNEKYNKLNKMLTKHSGLRNLCGLYCLKTIVEFDKLSIISDLNSNEFIRSVRMEIDN